MGRELQPGYSLGPAGVLDIYGVDSRIIKDAGELHTDLYGLSTATTVFQMPQDRPDLIPSMFSLHPIWGFTAMERRRISNTPGYIIVTGEFAGVDGGRSQSIYELSLGCSDEPIETHPRFISEIGGTPSSPRNGAVFIDPSTGKVTTSDAVGVFDHFKLIVGGYLNQFAGITSYLEASQMCWRERYCISLSSYPGGISDTGHIQSPPGAPTPPTGGNWLFMGVNFERRGNCYFVTNEWRGSGRRGWNQTIYGR